MLDERVAAVEAILFVSAEGIEIAAVGRAIGTSSEQATQLIDDLDAHYRAEGHALRVERQETRVGLVAAHTMASAIAGLQGSEKPQRLSAPAMDALAIIAYRQPVTRAVIERIRGVSSDYVLAVLLNAGLIEEVGRGESIGRPVLYGTTRTFLRASGVASLAELPPLDQS